tara:strand:- start:951 stop:2471 length:1521 start_codon:yes stop_codon:yes gene_type:complete
MSDKPISPYGEGGRVTETIRYNVTDSNGNRHMIIETFSVDMSGNNAGLTKTISARLNNGESVEDITTTNIERDGVVIDLLELAQNSPEREQKYHDRMNKTRIKALENGTSGQFDEALIKSGAYDSIAGGASINDIEIKSENTRNNERVKKEDLANERAIEKFNKSTQVKNEELYYPIDMITEVDDSQDFIYIEQYSYQPPQPVGSNKPSDVIKSGVTRAQNIQERHGGCKLPIPNKLGVSNGVNWGEAKANAVELAAFDTARGGVQTALAKPGEILNVITGGLKETGKTLQNLRQDINAANRNPNNINSGTILSGVLARSALGSIGINVDIDQFITRQTGAAINPNLELLFGGPQLRSFNFDFNFAPNSDREATMVRKIQRWFKQGMLPSRSRATATSESSLFLASPNVFRITYRNNKRRIKGLNTFKICALTSVQIDFTPDGVYQSYEDSSAISMPIRSTMGLSFTELTPIFRDDYAPFTNDPSMLDAGLSVSGANSITDDDIGF